MRNVARVLAETGKVSREQAEKSIEKNDNTDEVWREFVRSGVVTENEVFEALARIYRLEFVDILNIEIPAEVLMTLSSSFCREERVIPIELRGDYIFIATDDPQNYQAIDEISASVPYTPEVKIVSPAALQDTLDRFFRDDDEIDKLSEELEQVTANDTDDDEEDNIDDSSPIVKFVNLLISQAIRDRASDIHVEPGPKELRVRYRVDGVLHVVQRADRGIQNGVISRIKVMSEIDIGERRKPQDGRMTVKHSGRSTDIRVVSLPTVWGEKIVMRILDGSNENRSIDTIAMSDDNKEKFLNAISKPQGMVLVTGPTGSGKTSTLYTALGHVSQSTVSVVTVEDPVEKRIDGITQIQINAKAGNTISNSLKFILRADPDVVFVGEVRDPETAKIAIDASMTGHLVLSTLHTNGAPEAAARLVEMGVEPYLVGSSVTCVVAQRLARVLCSDCKKIGEIDPAVIEKNNFPFSTENIYIAVGCKVCSDIGYKGRIALTEVLVIDEDIDASIIAGGSASTIRKIAEKKGMISLRGDGWSKVSQGITTIEEILRVTTI